MDLSVFFMCFGFPSRGVPVASLVSACAHPDHKRDSYVCIFMVYHETLTKNNIEHGSIINIFPGVTGANGYGFVWLGTENQINCQLP